MDIGMDKPRVEYYSSELLAKQRGEHCDSYDIKPVKICTLGDLTLADGWTFDLIDYYNYLIEIKA